MMPSRTILLRSTLSGLILLALPAAGLATMAMALSLPTWTDNMELQSDDEEEESQLRQPQGQAKAKTARTLAGKGPPRGGGGGGQPNRSSGSGPSPSGSRQGGDLAVAVAELCLETKAEVREIRSFLEWTVLLPLALAFVQEALNAGKDYSKLAKDRKGENLGSAHILISLRSLRAIPNTEFLDKDETLLNTLKALWDVISKCPRDEVAHYIHVFRMQRPKKANESLFEGNYAKFTFRFAPATPASRVAEDFQIALLNACKAQKWVIKAGAPPRNQRERRVRELLGR